MSMRHTTQDCCGCAAGGYVAFGALDAAAAMTKIAPLKPGTSSVTGAPLTHMSLNPCIANYKHCPIISCYCHMHNNMPLMKYAMHTPAAAGLIYMHTCTLAQLGHSLVMNATSSLHPSEQAVSYIHSPPLKGLLDQRVLLSPGGVNAVTEDAAAPSPGLTWNGILGALRQGNTPDGAASLDGGRE